DLEVGERGGAVRVATLAEGQEHVLEVIAADPTRGIERLPGAAAGRARRARGRLPGGSGVRVARDDLAIGAAATEPDDGQRCEQRMAGAAHEALLLRIAPSTTKGRTSNHRRWPAARQPQPSDAVVPTVVSVS